jgi:LysR family transcriptional activator of glutamate synthase operon
MLTAFSEEHPNFTLSCTTITQDKLQQAGLPVQYNFLLAAEDAVPDYFSEDMDNIPLFEDHPMVMLPLHHPLAKKQSIDIRDLRGENIFLPMKIYTMYDQLSELFAACDMQLPEDNAYSHLVSQELVAKGLGVGFTSHTYLSRTTAEVRCLPISNAHTPSTTRIYWRKSSPLTPEQCAFRDFIKAYYDS